jgi:hypothetical protein
MKYAMILTAQVVRHKLIPKLHSIYRETNGSLSPEQQKQMEAIDRVKSEAMVHAEAKCSNFCMGTVEFSADVNEAKGLKFCWQLYTKDLGKRCLPIISGRLQREWGLWGILSIRQLH